jgi:ABC-type histidine transport system ATPase subunit
LRTVSEARLIPLVPDLAVADGVVGEAGDPREVLANPQHERTKLFLSKVL